MKIAVFMGGSSPEREVSLNSGKAVTKGLRESGHEATAYDVEWIAKKTLFDAIEDITNNGTDIVFLTLHGGLGENGGIQGILEATGIPYTGSGITASALAMDKDLSKKLFLSADIPTAPWITGTEETIDHSHVAEEIGFPCIVKPVDLGSTIGFSVVKGISTLDRALKTALSISKRVMVESYIPGKELTIPILGDKPLPIVEVRPKHGIYDYESKYTPGKTEYLVPAPISPALSEKIRTIALNVFAVLGLRDIARIDFRLDEDEQPLCFEANTLPGMTATSLVPKSALSAGISFNNLVSRIAAMALQRKGKY